MQNKNRLLPIKLFSFILIIVLSISCSNDLDLSSGNDPQNSLTPSELRAQQLIASGIVPELTELRAIANTRAATSFTVSSRYTIKFNDAVYFNADRAARDEMARLNTSFAIRTINASVLADSIAKPRRTYYSPRASQIPGASETFTPRGLYYLDRFIFEMYNATSSTHNSIYQRHKSLVGGPTVNDIPMDEKIALVSIFEIINQYALNFFFGSYGRVYSDMVAAGISPTAEGGRISGCEVNWRSTMGSAVVGGVVGATIGFKAGAGGGTVAFPGLGTATGALAGTVFGFATGFVSGALTDVASQLLLSCFRKVEILQPIDYAITNPQFPCPYGACTTEFQDFKKWYSLN